MDRVAVPTEGAKLPTGGEIPQLHRSIEACRGQIAAINTEGHTLYFHGVSAKRQEFRARRSVPHIDLVRLLAHRSNQRAIAASSPAKRNSDPSAKAKEFLARHCIPHLDFVPRSRG